METRLCVWLVTDTWRQDYVSGWSQTHGDKTMCLAGHRHMETRLCAWLVTDTWRQDYVSGWSQTHRDKTMCLAGHMHMKTRQCAWLVTGTWRQDNVPGWSQTHGDKTMCLAGHRHMETRLCAWLVTVTWRQDYVPGGKWRQDYVTPVLRHLQWLLVRCHVDLKLALLVYKLLHGLTSSYFANDCILVSSDKFCCCLCSTYVDIGIVTHLGIMNFLVAGPKVWNIYHQACDSQILSWANSNDYWKQTCSVIDGTLVTLI